MPTSTTERKRCKPGDIVVRHDQPDQQGTVAHITAGVVVFVYWHGRAPSYEYINDLRQQEPQPKRTNKKGRRPQATARVDI